MEEDAAPPIMQIDPALEKQQIARLQALRSQRDNQQVTAALQTLEQRARGTGNLMPPLIAAVESYATLGEIADTLRGVFGEYQEHVVLSGA